MNVPRYVLLRRLLLAVLLVASASASQTSVDASPLTLLRNAPLSLPRLTANPAKFGKKPVPAGAFEVLDLTPGENAVRKSRGEAAYLEIEPGAEWQRKLRTPRRAVSYVSFTLNASVGSLVDVGGARFAITISDRDPTYAALRPLGAGIPISHEMPFLLFGGARMGRHDFQL